MITTENGITYICLGEGHILYCATEADRGLIQLHFKQSPVQHIGEPSISNTNTDSRWQRGELKAVMQFRSVAGIDLMIDQLQEMKAMLTQYWRDQGDRGMGLCFMGDMPEEKRNAQPIQTTDDFTN